MQFGDDADVLDDDTGSQPLTDEDDDDDDDVMGEGEGDWVSYK
jgi:E3 ubiquitin-protein ligase HUWE1